MTNMPTAITTALNTLLDDQPDAIEAWFANMLGSQDWPIYNSVDIRHAGFKIAPVDTNLFPAGFNNLAPSAYLRATQAIAERFKPNTHILIYPEEHTRNLKYLENVNCIANIFRDAGMAVRMANPFAAKTANLRLTSPSGKDLVWEVFEVKDGACELANGWRSDVLIMNNDFTRGLPDWLPDIKHAMLPSPYRGWQTRTKTIHFDAYTNIATQFARAFNLDPWLLNTYTAQCGQINFLERTGLECVAMNTEKLLDRIQLKYDEYGIKHAPKVFIKANTGTYGMGIMTASSGDEVIEMNRKVRKKMHTIKSGSENTEVILQEAVPTVDEVGGHTAEAMIYCMNGQPIGGAYRVHDAKNAMDNLNAVGMRFAELCPESGEAILTMSKQVREKMPHCNLQSLGLIAKLAAIATLHEEFESDAVQSHITVAS